MNRFRKKLAIIYLNIKQTLYFRGWIIFSDHLSVIYVYFHIFHVNGELHVIAKYYILCNIIYFFQV